MSQFGGSAWEWHEERQQYYLHQFAVQQADFNFRHQDVLDEMHNIMRFWLDKVTVTNSVDALSGTFAASDFRFLMKLVHDMTYDTILTQF